MEITVLAIRFGGKLIASLSETLNLFAALSIHWAFLSHLT